jgi:hypothetical protein
MILWRPNVLGSMVALVVWYLMMDGRWAVAWGLWWGGWVEAIPCHDAALCSISGCDESCMLVLCIAGCLVLVLLAPASCDISLRWSAVYIWSGLLGRDKLTRPCSTLSPISGAAFKGFLVCVVD